MGASKTEADDNRYRLLVQSVKDYAIFMLDENGYVQTWNAGAEAAKGYTADEIIGRHMSTFYSPEDREAGRPQRMLELARRDGRVEDVGWRVRKDGTKFWADVVITALRDETGKLTGFGKVTRDLTEKRAAEEALRQSEERFRVMVQSVKDYAIFMLDPDGRVATWNAGALRIHGYSPEEIIGQHFSRFYPEGSNGAERSRRELEIAAAEGMFEEEDWRVRKNGTRFWASVVLESMRDAEGRLIGFAKVTRDLTERRAADEERLRLAQAQEAIRMRDEFLSIASHELKTPLSAVQIQLENLLHGVQTLDERTRGRAERALRGGRRLSELVETLLDVSRIASGRFTLTRSRFDLRELASEIVDRHREQAEREQSELIVHAGSPLVGEWDRLRVDQVLTNLVGNALKYAAGSRIQVEVKEAGDEALLIVSDEGPGISAEDLNRVFGRFERAASMRNFGGLGLGLYVSRQIAEAHGGTVTAEAVNPRGAKFTVRLPRSAANRAIPSHPQRSEVGA